MNRYFYDRAAYLWGLEDLSFEEEKATMTKARYTADDYACDALERPVRLNGIDCVVTDYDGVSGPGGRVTVQAWSASEHQFVGEPVEVALVECIPLCAHCHQELDESEDEAPGTCTNPACFLYRGQPAADDVCLNCAGPLDEGDDAICNLCAAAGYDALVRGGYDT